MLKSPARHGNFQVHLATGQRMLRQHRPRGKKARPGTPIARFEHDMSMDQLRSQKLADRVGEQLRAIASLGGEPDAPYRALLAALDMRRFVDQVGLVEDLDLRQLTRADFAQYFVDLRDALA